MSTGIVCIAPQRFVFVVLPGPQNMGGAEQLAATRLNLVRLEEAGLAGSERFKLQSGRLLEEDSS